MLEWFLSLQRVARWLARKYEIQYHAHEGDFSTVALEGAWKAVCTFRQMRPEPDGSLRLGADGLPVGLYSWAKLKITGAIIDGARDEMRQHGCGRKESSRRETLSLDVPWDNDGERTLGDTLECVRSEPRFEQVEDHEMLLALRARMTPKEWDILTRYADGQTLKSIGEDVYGVTESRICQLMKGITAKARRILATTETSIPVNPLTPLQREEHVETQWLGVLSAGDAQEEQRLAKGRERFARAASAAVG